jgi:hypothetical protein
VKLTQVPYGQIEHLRLRWTSATGMLPQTATPGAEALLLFSEREAQATLRLGQDVLGVQGDGRVYELLLNELCTRHLPRFAWIVDIKGNAITLQVHTFLHILTLPTIEIGVDEKVLKTLARIDPKLGYLKNALTWLNEQFILDGEDGKRGFANIASTSEAFALLGQTTRAFIKRVKRSDSTETLRVDRVARSTSRNEGHTALVCGDIQFVDDTIAGKLRAETAAQLSLLGENGSSFLALWSRYGAIESEVALRKARKAGFLKYDYVESLQDGRYRFSLALDCTLEDANNFKRILNDEQGLNIEAVQEVPEVLERDMTWAEYDARMRLKDAPQSSNFGGRVHFNSRDKTVTLLQQRSDETAPPDKGVLVVSLRGDVTRLKRREEAELAIKEARCPMPQLGLLLEGRAVHVPRRGSIEPMTPNVRRKVFGSRSPTPTQERALRVALNTPDIALIQGPPGTGKTTIIVALAERLQEVWDTQYGVQGRLLLSGFQHDAVDNATQRMNLNGLPPVKFGGRSNSSEDAERINLTIDRWCRERSTALRENLPPRPASALLKEISEVIQSYLLAPGTREHTASLLSDVTSRVQGIVPTALTDRLVALERELRTQEQAAKNRDPDLDRLIRYVRALRCDACSFKDDGARNANRLARELQRAERQDEQTIKLLKTASGWVDTRIPPFLDDLRRLRRRLLLQLLPPDRTDDTTPHARTDVLELLSEVRDRIEQHQNVSRDGADEAIWRFLTALEEEPEAVKRAIISYTSVFAATCQQSARHELANLKGSEGYDTVVVDEAARAMPLDLFIPMARAKRRIVLVGDHRQLPHIIDQELERELEEALGDNKNSEERVSEMLKESLFERLFKDLRDRETRDGIARVITLDEQYRMHPLLGQFVSDQFYKPHGEAFRSPRPASDFVHALPGYSGPAAWLSVPRRLGAERDGQSKSRPVEAKAIVTELKRLMDAKEGRELTFGVIAFYKQQVKVIEDALVEAGIVSRADETAEIIEPYRELLLPNGRMAERLRFGTVDAFQGMEFDVVFLSMVRSNPHGVFGHVTSPNRLCVAMSRQKRLLVVAGDDGMLQAANAPAAIGPLVEFHRLSEVHNAPGI